jgi:hypothetical protein
MLSIHVYLKRSIGKMNIDNGGMPLGSSILGSDIPNK